MPPITVSNPSEHYGYTEKTFTISTSREKVAEINVPSREISRDDSKASSTADPTEDSKSAEPRKEQRSMMREILAFSEWRISSWRSSTWRLNRKTTQKNASNTSSITDSAAATTTTTTTTKIGSRFAAAFGARTESDAATPLMRQSTFSSSPRASSGAAKSAVTKQTSLSGALESKLSLKILNSKMSFRLRRPDKSKEKSGDELSDVENSSDSKADKVGSSSSDMAFELDSVRFEKVSESYIKHDKIREETIEDSTPSPVQIVDMHDIELCIDKQLRKSSVTKTTDEPSEEAGPSKAKATSHSEPTTGAVKSDSVDSIEAEGITINGDLAHQASLLEENVNALKATLEHLVLKPEPIYATAKCGVQDATQRTELQCPTFEIMPPSRRSSFDPPRSPYLDNLRSPCETDQDLMNRNRLDSVGDSFEMVDTDRNQSRYATLSKLHQMNATFD